MYCNILHLTIAIHTIYGYCNLARLSFSICRSETLTLVLYPDKIKIKNKFKFIKYYYKKY